MPNVKFDSFTWNDSWVKHLSLEAKILFLYLLTNGHKNIIGLYRIPLDTIAFETGLTLDSVEDIIDNLEPKVLYDRTKEVAWVVNYANYQLSEKDMEDIDILTVVDKSISHYQSHPYMERFLVKYKWINEAIDDINIPVLIDKKKASAILEEEFERFWKAYPKKKSKGQAKKAWKKLKPDKSLIEQILVVLDKARQSRGWVKDDGDYIPYPSTWLNAEGWLDDYSDTRPFINTKQTQDVVASKRPCTICGTTSWSSMVGNICMSCYKERKSGESKGKGITFRS